MGALEKRRGSGSAGQSKKEMGGGSYHGGMLLKQQRPVKPVGYVARVGNSKDYDASPSAKSCERRTSARVFQMLGRLSRLRRLMM